MHFLVDFGAVLLSPGPPLGCLSAPFSSFGCFWAPLGLSLAPLGSHFGPPGHHPEPFYSPPWTDFGSVFPHPRPPSGPLLASFGCFWAPLGLSLDPLGPHFGRPTFELIAFVLVRLSPDECWRTPVESKRILRNRLAIIEVLRQKFSNSRLPPQAESQKQGGRRCVARRASSIMEGYKNQFRQRIEAETKGRGKELSSRV